MPSHQLHQFPKRIIHMYVLASTWHTNLNYVYIFVPRGALRLHIHVRLVSWLLRRYMWCQDTRLSQATIMFFKRRAGGKHSLTNHTDMGTPKRCRYTCTLCLVVNVGGEVYTPIISWAGKRIAEVAATGTQPWIAGVQLGDCGRRKWTPPEIPFVHCASKEMPWEGEMIWALL